MSTTDTTPSPTWMARKTTTDTAPEDPAVSTEMTDDSQTDTTAPEGQTPEVEEQEPTGNEAKVYRLRLRDMTAERDQLVATVAAYQRAEVGRLATSGDGPKLAAAADLQLAGVKTEDLLAEDGTVDPEKVSAAVAQVLADHPHWVPRPTKGRAPRLTGAGQRESSASPVRSLQQIVRGG